MGLNSDQLDAFFETARLKSFSLAAKALSISQPALSHRVRKLEETLKATLFVRGTQELSLTSVGHKLLLYCQNRRDLEIEFLKNDKESISGVLRIAGFSSIVRSRLIPALHKFILSHPQIQLEIFCRELDELPQFLKHSETDFVFTVQPILAEGVESICVGEEENILIESQSAPQKIPEVYFDHDLKDQTTFDFFKKQVSSSRPPKKWKRSFLDEIYTIIDAVECGWGRAVVPMHLIKNNKKVRRVKWFSSVKTDIYLNYYTQPFYHPLHKAFLDEILKKSNF